MSQLASDVSPVHHAVLLVRRQAALGEKKEGAGDWDTSGVAPGSPDIAAATAKAIREKSKYLQANLRVDDGADAKLTAVVETLLRMRAAHKEDEWGWDAAEDVTDLYRATLMLFGIEGTGTHTHADWSQAKNIAFASDKVTLL